MKNLRITIDSWFNRLDVRWRKLSIKKQRRYTLYFFMGYLILTIGVILRVGYDTWKSDHSMVIGHIENPVIQQKQSRTSALDSMSMILKNKLYEK
jgi:hypothetical protein